MVHLHNKTVGKMVTLWYKGEGKVIIKYLHERVEENGLLTSVKISNR